MDNTAVVEYTTHKEEVEITLKTYPLHIVNNIIYPTFFFLFLIMQLRERVRRSRGRTIHREGKICCGWDWSQLLPLQKVWFAPP